MKIRPVEAGLFHADGRTGSRAGGRTDRSTDMMKLRVAFRNFANAPHKKYPNLSAISFRQGLPNNSTAWSFYICITGIQYFMTENRNRYCRPVRGRTLKIPISGITNRLIC